MIRWVVLGVVLGFGQAHAAPLVQCEIGSFSRAMPDYACKALEHGARKLRLPGDPGPAGDTAGQLACAAEMERYLVPNYPGAFLPACSAVWQAMTVDHAASLANQHRLHGGH